MDNPRLTEQNALFCNNNQSSNYSLYLQHQFEKIITHLSVALEHHLVSIENNALRESMREHMLMLQQHLASDGKLGKLIGNEFMSQGIEKAVQAWLDQNINPFFDVIDEHPDYSTADKEFAYELFSPLVNYLQACNKTSFNKQKGNNIIPLAIKPWVEQRICHENPDIQPSFNTLLAQIKNLLIKRYKGKNRWDKANPHPSCFISYAWPLIPDEQQDETWTQGFVKQLALDLKSAGVNVRLDILESFAGKELVGWMKEMVEQCDVILVMGTQSLYEKHYDSMRYKSRVREELAHIRNRIASDHQQQKQNTVFGVLVSGDETKSFQQELSAYKVTRSFQQASYLKVLEQLLTQLFNAQTEEQQKDFANCWAPLKDVNNNLNPCYEGLTAPAIIQHYEALLNAKANRQALQQQRSIGLVDKLDPDTDATINIPHNLPFERNKQFIGRKEALTQLSQALKKEKVSAIIQTIQGLGGIGKTQLALEYAWRSLKNKQYQLVWWLTGTNETLLQNSFLSLADQLAIPTDKDVEHRIHNTKIKLSSLTHWLLIIDDAKDYQTVQSYLPTGAGHILITSRHTQYWQNTLPLNPFSRAESIQLLSKIIDKQNSNFQQAANRLAELLGDLPLALAQAGAYIYESKITIDKYIHYFKQQHQKLWQYETPPKDYPATVATTWHITFEVLKQKYSILPQLLAVLAILTPSAIPRELLIEWLKDKADEFEVNQLLIELERYALINLQEKNLSLHQLVQLVIQDAIPIAELSNYNEQMLVILMNKMNIENQSPAAIQQRLTYLPHLAACCTRRNKQDDSQADILNQIGNIILHDFGQANKALLYFEQALTMSQALHPAPHPAIATLLDHVGLTYQRLGQSNKALSYLKPALTMFQTLYSAPHPAIATSLDHVGIAHHGLNQLPYLEQALTMRETLYPLPHKDVALSLNNVGEAYQDLGQHDKALNYYERALTICEALDPPSKPDVAGALNNIGMAYEALGQFDKALPYLERALTMFQALYPSPHQNEAVTLKNIGSAYKALGQLDKALPYLEQALSTFQALDTSPHHDIARLLNNIGSTYQALGQLDKALPYLEQALSMFQALDTSPHHDIARLLNNIGAAYLELDQLDKALPKLKQALIMTQTQYPATYLDVAISLTNVGVVYKELGQFEKALPYFEQALTMRKALHPAPTAEIVTLLNNVGETYRELEQFEKALPYFEQALTMVKTLYTAPHPEIASSLNNLGEIYQKLDQFEKALLYLEQGLIMRKGLYSVPHAEIVTSLRNKGEIYRKLEQFEKALPYFEQVLTMVQTLYTTPHPDIALSLKDVGEIYRELKQFEKALPYLEQALTMLQAFEPESHLAIIMIAMDIALVYKDLDQFEKALPYLALTTDETDYLSPLSEEASKLKASSYPFFNAEHKKKDNNSNEKVSIDTHPFKPA